MQRFLDRLLKLAVELGYAVRVQQVTLSEKLNSGPPFPRSSEVMYTLERANQPIASDPVLAQQRQAARSLARRG